MLAKFKDIKKGTSFTENLDQYIQVFQPLNSLYGLAKPAKQRAIATGNDYYGSESRLIGPGSTGVQVVPFSDPSGNAMVIGRESTLSLF